MLKVDFDVIGVSDLAFGKPVFEKKGDGETHDQHERRTWKDKINVTPEGQCFIQPFALKNAIESASKRISLKVPGESKKTFTKLFVQGILVVDRMLLTTDGASPLMIDAVEAVEMFVPSDGKRGGPKRVMKIFPMVRQWRTHASVYVFDNKITEDVIGRHLREAGQFIGFGSMRVENGGINGRFKVESLVSSEVEA